MKRTIIAFAVSISTLMTTAAFAGIFAENQEATGRQQLAADLSGSVVLKSSHCESKGAKLPPAEQVAFIKSCLAEASSPANVKAVALQEKKAYCDENVKSKALQGSEKESYLTACMNHNEALAQFEIVNREDASTITDVASMNFDNALQQLTGFVTAFWKASPAGSR